MATFSVRLEAGEGDHELIRELSVDLASGADGAEIVRVAEKLGERLGLTGFRVTVVGAGAVISDTSIAPEAPPVAEVLPLRTAELTAVPSIRWAEWRYARRSVDTLIGPRKPRGKRSGRVTSAMAMTLLGESKPL